MVFEAGLERRLDWNRLEVEMVLACNGFNTTQAW